MKHLFILTLLAAALVGCGTFPTGWRGTGTEASTTGNRLLVRITNSVPVEVAKVVEEITITETAQGLVTNTVSRTVKETNLVSQVSLVPNPALVAGVETAREVSGWLPEPIGTVVNGVLGLGMLGLTAYAKRKSKLVNTLVAGVEQADSKDVKKAIQVLAIATGLEGELNKLVSKNTKRKSA